MSNTLKKRRKSNEQKTPTKIKHQEKNPTLNFTDGSHLAAVQFTGVVLFVHFQLSHGNWSDTYGLTHHQTSMVKWSLIATAKTIAVKPQLPVLPRVGCSSLVWHSNTKKTFTFSTGHVCSRQLCLTKLFCHSYGIKGSLM